MPANPVHHTSTSSDSWDGPGAVAAMPANASTLHYCHAWQSADAGDVKSNYKFPHHKPKGGAANLAACRNGLARLSSASIPSGDREGVRKHLQAHLDDAARSAEAGPREIFRDDLTRQVAFRGKKEPDGDVGKPGARSDGMTLDGYGAVFDAETVIDSWEGTFRETLARGCFKKSLKERTPRMQFDHGRHPVVGSIPIGTFTDGYPQEDDQGLRVVGRLLDNWLVAPVRDAIAAGAIDGMSFRFSVIREMWTMPDGTKLTDGMMIADYLWQPPSDGLLLRTIQEVKLSEVGPVVWPAYEQTSVGVRDNAVIELARLHEPGMRKLLAQAVLMVDDREWKDRNTARPQPSAFTPARHSVEPEGSGNAPGEHREPTPEAAGRPRSVIDRWQESRRPIVNKMRS